MGFKQSERAQNPGLRFLGQTDDLAERFALY